LHEGEKGRARVREIGRGEGAGGNIEYASVVAHAKPLPRNARPFFTDDFLCIGSGLGRGQGTKEMKRRHHFMTLYIHAPSLVTHAFCLKLLDRFKALIWRERHDLAGNAEGWEFTIRSLDVRYSMKAS